MTRSVPVRPAVILALGATVLVLVVGLVLDHAPTVAAAELRVLQWFDARHTPVGDGLALVINTGFGPLGAAVVAVVASCVVGVAARSAISGLRCAALIAVPWVVATLIKAIVGRQRPDMAALADALVPVPASSSYPSGHTAFAAALGCAIVLTLAARVGTGRVRRSTVVIVALAAGVLALVTAWSRMYLGVHQPTDVAAALILVPPVAWCTDVLLRARSASHRVN